MTHTLSFPGLGIGEFSINTVATTILGRPITWYGLILTTGIIAGFFYAMWRAKTENIKSDDIIDLALFTIVSAMIGARAYYVAMNLESYKTFLDVIAIWNGGIAVYGSIIGGGIAAFCVAKYKKIKYTKIFDLIVPGLMLGQAIGRWGNFMNAEAYGTQTTLPWRMGIHASFYTQYVHPTFLYESVWNLIGFIWINLYYKKKKFDGEIFLLYITWYGLGRMFIEGLRTDSLYIGDIRASQALAFLSMIFGVVMLIICRITVKKKKAAAATADDGSSQSFNSNNGEEKNG